MLCDHAALLPRTAAVPAHDCGRPNSFFVSLHVAASIVGLTLGSDRMFQGRGFVVSCLPSCWLSPGRVTLNAHVEQGMICLIPGCDSWGTNRGCGCEQSISGCVFSERDSCASGCLPSTVVF